MQFKSISKAYNIWIEASLLTTQLAQIFRDSKIDPHLNQDLMVNTTHSFKTVKIVTVYLISLLMHPNLYNPSLLQSISKIK